MIPWTHCYTMSIELYAFFCFLVFKLFSWWGSKWDWYMISLEEDNIFELRVWGKILQPPLDFNEKILRPPHFLKIYSRLPCASYVANTSDWYIVGTEENYKWDFKNNMKCPKHLSCCYKVHNNIIYHYSKFSNLYPTHAVVF